MQGYVSDTLKFMRLSAGTAFAPDGEQCELFAELLLDGMRWMTTGAPARWDWSVKGRDMGTTARRVLFNSTTMVRRNVFLRHCCIENDHFAKTGSGQR